MYLICQYVGLACLPASCCLCLHNAAVLSCEECKITAQDRHCATLGLYCHDCAEDVHGDETQNACHTLQPYSFSSGRIQVLLCRIHILGPCFNNTKRKVHGLFLVLWMNEWMYARTKSDRYCGREGSLELTLANFCMACTFAWHLDCSKLVPYALFPLWYIFYQNQRIPPNPSVVGLVSLQDLKMDWVLALQETHPRTTAFFIPLLHKYRRTQSLRASNVLTPFMLFQTMHSLLLKRQGIKLSLHQVKFTE